MMIYTFLNIPIQDYIKQECNNGPESLTRDDLVTINYCVQLSFSSQIKKISQPWVCGFSQGVLNHVKASDPWDVANTNSGVII